MHTPHCLRSVLVPLCLLLLAPACTTFHGLGDRVDVDLDSAPEGAEVCVLDETIWYFAGKQRFEQALAKGAWDPWFDRYRSTEGRTPVTLNLPQSIQHLVLHKDTRFVHREYAAAADAADPKSGRRKLLVRIAGKDGVQ